MYVCVCMCAHADINDEETLSTLIYADISVCVYVCVCMFLRDINYEETL
jgi:hypothetical protein